MIGLFKNMFVCFQEALKIFVHSLPVDAHFNIFFFGSHFDSLFSSSQPLTDETLALAKAKIEETDADYGGTEIYSPLEKIFLQPKAISSIISLCYNHQQNSWKININLDILLTNC